MMSGNPLPEATSSHDASLGVAEPPPPPPQPPQPPSLPPAAPLAPQPRIIPSIGIHNDLANLSSLTIFQQATNYMHWKCGVFHAHTARWRSRMSRFTISIWAIMAMKIRSNVTVAAKRVPIF
ncbi:unnamed protein product [Gongylonema pulchrum]|uniref:Uncharacterized protein n=1 Tax=Gongylonema pulchrum TaxID=637853 RepID=A0A183E9S8_9BILA|nr:unnamed protein product [Gongylonema pulchrum]